MEIQINGFQINYCIENDEFFKCLCCITGGIVNHMTWTTHENYFIILFSGFCYQRMMLTNIDSGVINSEGDAFIPWIPLLAKALSITANIPSASEDADKHISKNWFTTTCWLMSNNLTVTGFIFLSPWSLLPSVLIL